MTDQEKSAVFEAFREWMLEDPGGARLVDEIQGLDGYSEWSEEAERVDGRGGHSLLHALASGFVMTAFDMEWKRIGGNSNDPAP